MKRSKIVDDILIPLDLKEVEKPRFCFLVFSSKEKHIEIVIDCVENVIRDKENYEVKRLDDSLKSEDSQYSELRDLLNGCSFAVIILDGLRPNVVFEYGILKGMGKPCIVLLEEEADVDLVNYYAETEGIEIKNPKIDMDKHFSDVKDRFYIRYNKNRPKEIREKIQKAYSGLKKDIEEEFIRMVFPNKEIVEKELRDQLITLSDLSKKKKEELKSEDEIEFRIIMRSIDGILKKHKIKLPKIYYSIISEILVKFNRQEEALRIIDPIIKDRAEDLDLMELKFMLLLDLGRYDDAIETVDSGIKLRPDVESIWHNKGILLERMGKKEEAELCYRQGIKFTHTCSSIHLNYGILLYEKNQFENALEQFERAIRKKSTDDNYLIWKALASDKLGKREEAIKIVEEAICYNDKNPNAWYILGKLSDDLTESIKHFDRTLSLDPKHGGALCSKGACLSNINKLDEAMEIFDKVKEVCLEYNSCTTLLLNIGRTLSKKMKFGEALSYVDKVFENNVNDVSALAVKAGILFDSGKEEEAFKIISRALELDPKASTAWYNQACMFAKLNRIDESIESLKKAIELDSSIKIDMKIDSDLDGIRKNEKFVKEFG